MQLCIPNIPIYILIILQMQLLQGLGIQNTIITDGKTPLNMYQSPQSTPLFASPGTAQ